MITLALLIIALALYFLGMKLMSDWFPYIIKMLEQSGSNKKLDSKVKVKMLLLWPYVVAKDIYDDFRAKHND